MIITLYLVQTSGVLIRLIAKSPFCSKLSDLMNKENVLLVFVSPGPNLGPGAEEGLNICLLNSLLNSVVQALVLNELLTNQLFNLGKQFDF